MIDVAALRALVGGGPSRAWLTFARVTAVVNDSDGETVWVDVENTATGGQSRCRLASAYVGQGFGLFVQPPINAEVLVAFASTGIRETSGGVEPDEGCGVVLAVLSNADAQLPQGNDAPDPATLLLVLGAAHKVVVKKAGGPELLRVDSGTGKVTLGDVAHSTQGVGLGDTLKAHLDALKTYIDGHTHPVSTSGVDPQGGTVASTGTASAPSASPSVPTVSSSIAKVEP